MDTKINLKELIKTGEVKLGTQNIKVPIKKVSGELYKGQTYMIPLRYLFYNDQNGRIGTAMSEYQAENGKLPTLGSEEYNSVIQNIIIQNNSKAMTQLKKNIQENSQQEPGYVLNDGRIIDGNRRFTACRMLEQDINETKTQYFEAVIIDDLEADRFEDKARLKELELRIQFGRLGKEDYDPIDRAIDVYMTVKVNHLMTNVQYARFADMKKTEVENKMQEAELIVEFLKFVNANPNNYALAKEMSLDGPLQDLVPQFKQSIAKSPQKNQILDALFTKLVQLRTSDKDKDFKRDFRIVVKEVLGRRKMGNDFIQEMQEPSDAVVDTLAASPTRSLTDMYKKLSDSPDATNAIDSAETITAKYAQKAMDESDKMMPGKLVTQAQGKIENVNTTVFDALSKMEKDRLKHSLDDLNNAVQDLLNKLG